MGIIHLFRPHALCLGHEEHTDYYRFLAPLKVYDKVCCRNATEYTHPLSGPVAQYLHGIAK